MFRSLNILRSGCKMLSLKKFINSNTYPRQVNVNYAVFSVNKVRKFCSSSHEEIRETGPDINAICKGDTELEYKLKVLMLEMEVMRQEGRLVPDTHTMKTQHWQELLTLPTISARKRYLEYVFKTIKTKENRKLRKKQKQLERGEKPERKKNETFEEFVSQYDLGHNNIFLRFYETTMNRFYNNKLIQAMKFGQKLVLDCGYDMNMTKRENINCAKQLMLLFADNRAHKDPFDLHFCSLNEDGILMQCLEKCIGTLHEPSFPLHMHEASYLDLFPKNQLLYLTPHCREEMTEFDHNTIYIIGAIVDKVNQEPLSLAKAKREGLRMAKFPLDKFLHWGSGSGKSLTLNQVASILLDLKLTNDWNLSLKHVPKRKLIDLSKPENVEYLRQKSLGQGPRLWKPKTDYSNKDITDRERMVKVRSIFYDE